MWVCLFQSVWMFFDLERERMRVHLRMYVGSKHVLYLLILLTNIHGIDGVVFDVGIVFFLILAVIEVVSKFPRQSVVYACRRK